MTYADWARLIDAKLNINDDGIFSWIGNEQQNLMNVQDLIQKILSAHPR